MKDDSEGAARLPDKATVGEVVEYRSEPEAEEFNLSRGEVDEVL